MSNDKGINIGAAKDTLIKIQAETDSMGTMFNTFSQILSNANNNYTSDNKSLLNDRIQKITSNFIKLKGLYKTNAFVIQKNIIKYTGEGKANADILDMD